MREMSVASFVFECISLCCVAIAFPVHKVLVKTRRLFLCFLYAVSVENFYLHDAAANFCNNLA